jgi:Zn-dependent protease with chaperone function/tetratricopeptide (TPR) repeat protein
MSVLQAHFFDGKSSLKRPVSVMINGNKLKVVGRDVDEEFDARGVRRSLRIGNTPRWLYLPGGGACVTADNDAVDRMTRDRRYEQILHRWESRPVYAVISIGLVLATLWVLLDRVLPAAIEQIAARIPVEAEAALGRETLAGMEKYLLKPSELPPKRKEALAAKFNAMARAADPPVPHRLEFRASPVIGANAFALPSGIIVMTDELVRRARNDQEVLAVLAHELGHVHHRHTMRSLLEASATALIIAAVTGDIASTTSLAAAAPTVLLQTKYSRDNEREADSYAIALMRKTGIEPHHFAAILARLEDDDERRGGIPGFLLSHPPTEEREKLAGGRPARADEEGGQGEDASSDAALVPESLKLVAVDPVQRQVLGLLEKRDFAALEKLLGGHQWAFEADPDSSRPLENAFAAFRKVPRNGEAALNEWVGKHSSSYVALVARATYSYAQGLDARGGRFLKDTPDENVETMRFYLGKARRDLDRSLKLAQKPYMSRLLLMAVAGTSGSRRTVRTQYLEAVKLAPRSVELRLAYMTSLEPRWGGSLASMEAFVAESRAQLKDTDAAARLAARIPAYRGHEHQRAKEYTQALQLYDESIALHADAGTLCERSYVLSQLKRDAEALADVRLALSKVRDNRYCLERATSAAARSSATEDVIPVLDLVIEVDPRSHHAYNQRGWRHHQQGRVDLAFQDYLASAQLGDAWGQLQAGKLYWAGRGTRENRDEAVAWLRKSAEQGNPDAKLSLQQALDQMSRK